VTQVLTQLIELLELERIEVNLFRGQSQDLGWGTVFGGQVLGQALSAAIQTVPPERQVHSLHGYFLRPGDVKVPVVYDVDRIRDGKSFTTRRVVAIQHGRPIFNLSASFQVDEDGYTHQDEMPDAPDPDSVLSEQELVRRNLKRLPAMLAERATAERPLELRPIDPLNPFEPDARPPHQMVWDRAAGELPDNPALHRCLLTYASDFSFVATAMRPHAVSWWTPGMQVASLDHAMWFYRPFRMDDWLLHVMESPIAAGARGLVRGRFFTRDGQLVAMTTQEGLMRNRTRQGP
jgi:acyl-CoA thioesterase-2